MLLDRVSLGVVMAASGENDGRPELAAINVNRTRTAASNGHFALMAKHPGTNDDCVPVIEGVSEEKVPEFHEISIPAKVARDMLKVLGTGARKRMQWDEHVRLDEARAEAGMVRVGYTDLDTPLVWTTRPAEGPFPAIERVMPKGRPVMRIAFNGKYMEAIVKAFALAGNVGDGMIMDFWTETGAVILRPAIEEAAARIEALLMPIRMPGAMELKKQETTAEDVETAAVGSEQPEAAREAGESSPAERRREAARKAVATRRARLAAMKTA